MLVVTAVAFAALPLLLPGAVLFDVARFRFRMPTVRSYLFVLQYLANDSLEILLWPLYPLVPDLAERVMWWSVELMTKRAAQLLGVRIEVDKACSQYLSDGPVIMVARHVSLLDAFIPTLVCGSSGLRPRGIMMAELAQDPGFDIVYGRLGSVFIPRAERSHAIELIETMTADVGPEHALILFPEGRIFSPARRTAALRNLRESSPERADSLSALKNSLPPKPGGFLALLNALPGADVVAVGHCGLEPYPAIKDLALAAPVGLRVAVSVERFPRGSLPESDKELIEWLDHLWLDLDAEASLDLLASPDS
jgi:1-acyl-sn-glycerol-3-phosphate acyltransferase